MHGAGQQQEGRYAGACAEELAALDACLERCERREAWRQCKAPMRALRVCSERAREQEERGAEVKA